MNNAKPAFPCGTDTNDIGMTLRDYFAAKALQGFCANHNTQPVTQAHFDNLSEDAWRMADAMLKARES
jgi:hypothetical protein